MRAAPHLVQVDNKFRGRGFQIVAVSDEPVATIAGFVRAQNASYGIAQAPGTPRQYKIPGYPHAYIIDRQGKVIWRGHPASINDGMIEAWLGGSALPQGSPSAAEGSGQSGWLLQLMVAVVLGAIAIGVGVKALTGNRQRPMPNAYFPAPMPPAGLSPAGPRPEEARADVCGQCGSPRREGRKQCMTCGADYS